MIDGRDAVPSGQLSAIISQGDNSTLNEKAKAVNKELKTQCETNDLHFIEHENIDEAKHLNGSSSHLNRMGTVLLANNFTKYLKAYCDDGTRYDRHKS